MIRMPALAPLLFSVALNAQQPGRAVQMKVPAESLKMAVEKGAPKAKRATARTSSSVPAAITAIKESDLKRDLYFLASDAMRGREAGTLDELRASGWIAEQLHQIGIEPAGNDGTYFQWWPMRRNRV